MEHIEYVRTDKNGTKIYYDYTCPRCGGAGRSDKWCFTGHTCFKCNGTGKRVKPLTVKEYTPEYRATLEARRAEREANKPQLTAEEIECKAAALEAAKAEQLKERGFSPDGIAYVHTGNTYPIKDSLRRAGGKFDTWLRAWIVPKQITGCAGVQITEVHAEELYKWENGCYQCNGEAFKALEDRIGRR